MESHYSAVRDLQRSFRASLEQSLLSSLPDTSALLRDLQDGIFSRLDDSCRLLAQGQQRDDLPFWKDLFAYCFSSRQQHKEAKGQRLLQQPQGKLEDSHLLFCLKGVQGMRAAEAAASGQLLQLRDHADLTALGLVAVNQLASSGDKARGVERAASVSAAGKVQERVFAVKHFAGTVLYGTSGWLELNNDRVSIFSSRTSYYSLCFGCCFLPHLWSAVCTRTSSD